jgi:plasmid maintenance system killer protein
VEIHFDGNRLEREFNDHRLLIRRRGPRMAEVIRRRLDDLDAAPNLATMRQLPGRCHELTGDRAGQISLDLVHPQRLIFVSSEPVPRNPDGGLNWDQVTSVRIIGIEVTHE